jgi:hypothetical protein
MYINIINIIKYKLNIISIISIISIIFARGRTYARRGFFFEFGHKTKTKKLQITAAYIPFEQKRCFFQSKYKNSTLTRLDVFYSI